MQHLEKLANINYVAIAKQLSAHDVPSIKF
jgi:hypothetical protein